MLFICKDPALDAFYATLEKYWADHRDDAVSDEELLALEDGDPDDGYDDEPIEPSEKDELSNRAQEGLALLDAADAAPEGEECEEEEPITADPEVAVVAVEAPTATLAAQADVGAEQVPKPEVDLVGNDVSEAAKGDAASAKAGKHVVFQIDDSPKASKEEREKLRGLLKNRLDLMRPAM